MFKVKAIVSNDQTSDIMTTTKYAETMDDAEKMQLAIANIVMDRMNEKSESYTPGIKWGVKFETEDVNDRTVLEDITVADLKMFILKISRNEL